MPLSAGSTPALRSIHCRRAHSAREKGGTFAEVNDFIAGARSAWENDGIFAEGTAFIAGTRSARDKGRGLSKNYTISSET